MMERALKILREVFGYPAFRGDQGAIIEQVMLGNHVLALMPTGGGKSLCYQLPALMKEGITIVVCPLIALMQNQVAALTELGVRAAHLDASMPAEKVEAVLQAVSQQALTLLYVAPERLLSDTFLRWMDTLSITLFAIDEAHCVSQWGYQFRPEYQQLSLLAKRYPKVPRLALTATADEKTCQDMVHYLGLSTAKRFVASFDRPNLFYQVVAKHHAKQQLLDFMRCGFIGTSGIVYCASRKRVDQLTQWLRGQGIDALPYHAGLSADIRAHHQRLFLYQDNCVMVATVAFGLGIDKPDIRFVAHFDMPKSLENFYQESGRAGRDESPATSWLCYGLNDFVQLKKWISVTANRETQAVELERLQEVLAFCEITSCRRQYLLDYFHEKKEPCGYCDNCLTQPDTVDASQNAQKLLSSIYRTGQTFSAQHIVEVLRGKITPKITFYQHDQLSTYGIGQNVSEREWRALIRKLIAESILDVYGENHALRLLDKSRALLKGQASFSMVKLNRTSHTKRTAHWLRSERQERLWEALRLWRQDRAQKHHIPTYAVFSDRTLWELVKVRPQDLTALGDVYGIGQTKLAHYGEALLAIIRSI